MPQTGHFKGDTLSIMQQWNQANVKDTTIVSASAFVILAPGDVSPGHITLAPLSTNLIAPLSTCMCGNIKGSETNKNSV